MEKKKLQSISIAALIVSILPLATLVPSFLHLSLSDGIRTVWAGANIVFVLLGLILSVVCVRNRESRSVINIVSTAISAFWLLLMVLCAEQRKPQRYQYCINSNQCFLAVADGGNCGTCLITFFRSVRKRLCVKVGKFLDVARLLLSI